MKINKGNTLRDFVISVLLALFSLATYWALLVPLENKGFSIDMNIAVKDFPEMYLMFLVLWVISVFGIRCIICKVKNGIHPYLIGLRYSFECSLNVSCLGTYLKDSMDDFEKEFGEKDLRKMSAMEFLSELENCDKNIYIRYREEGL